MPHACRSRLPFLLALAALGLSLFSCVTTPPQNAPAGPGRSVGEAAATGPDFPFRDSARPVEARIADLLSRLTLEEKVGQMQMAAPAIERLGIPAYHWWNEALHGVARNGAATVFPQAIGMAATWNTDLHHQAAQVIALEGRAKHEEALRQGIHAIYTGLDMWSPNINIFRDPRWGRGQETYGEDPYLTGRLGVAFVTGLQGDDPFYFQTIATPKHFAVHSGPESERHRIDIQPSAVDLRTTYLPAFEACIREGHAFSVMSAYNRVDGLPCSANPHLLTALLRNEWRFQGYVTSDVDAVADVYRSHQTAATPEEAAAMSVQAGCDLNGGATYAALVGAVKTGLLREKDLDPSLTRLFTARFRLGEFDPPDRNPYAHTAYALNDRPQSDQLALAVARQSIVLLKNQKQTLPLDQAHIHSIAVIGPTADSIPALVGNYSGTPARPVTPLQGLRNALGTRGRVFYTAGCPLLTEQIPLAEPVPASCLFTDASRTTPGLTADYFGNIALAGGTLRSRIDRQVDFDWGQQNARDPLPPAEGMAARWTGVLVPPQTGDYQLGLTARDGFRMYLNGALLVDEWRTAGQRTTGASVHLEKDQPAAIVVEYFHPRADRPRGGSAAAAAVPAPLPREEAFIRLAWTRPMADGQAAGASGQLLFADALQAAQSADAVILVLGLTADLEREEHAVHYQGFSGGDRTSLDLPAVQERMLEQVTAAAGAKPVVLVLTSGSALSVNWAQDHVPAILEAWYPGQRGGEALADVLLGAYNPAGRLPITFYKSVEDLPPFTNYSMIAPAAGPKGGAMISGRTYRYFTGAPLYPFGYGLSYTRFEYTKVTLSSPSPLTTENVRVLASVKNTGSVAGEEVVQLYLNRRSDGAPQRPGVGPSDAGSDQAGIAAVSQPRKTLAGFLRILLQPGEEKTVEFTLTPHQLATVNAAGRRVLDPGPLTLQVGPNSATGVAQVLTVRGEAVTPAYGFVAPRVH